MFTLLNLLFALSLALTSQAPPPPAPTAPTAATTGPIYKCPCPMGGKSW
jgi:hypothetical protein